MEKMPRRVRIYGKRINTWTHVLEDGREVACQYEYAYRDYDVDTCELVGVGTEDFSMERYHKHLRGGWVNSWDGVRRNKGGHRWFENFGFVLYRRGESKLVAEYFNNKFKKILAACGKSADGVITQIRSR